MVVVQTGCCVTLIWWAWRAVFGNPWLVAGVAAGFALGASAVLAMRLGQLKITPEPGENAELVQRGPYRFIRHPMYAGLLLAMGMFALPSGLMIGASFWGILLIVLIEKIRIEERHWEKRDAAYAEYVRKTKRLVPGLW